MVDMAKAEEKKQIELYETWIASFTSIPINHPFSKMRKALRARQELMDGVRRLFEQQRKRRYAESKCLVVDMLLVLQKTLQDNGGVEGIVMSDQELIDNLLVFLIAGHETGTQNVMKLQVWLLLFYQLLVGLYQRLKILESILESLTRFGRTLRAILPMEKSSALIRYAFGIPCLAVDREFRLNKCHM